MSLCDELQCGYGGFQHFLLPSGFGSALRHVREPASYPDLLMSVNLSRNAVAMERGLDHLADGERAREDCSSCLTRCHCLRGKLLNTIELL